MSEDHSQPDFYRFNQDSLELVRWVAGRVQCARHILDLGAGSGVIGIELAQRLSPETLTLVELQEDFLPFLQENSKKFLTEKTKVNIVVSSFSDWRTDKKADVIVCNPPYYFPESGRISPDPRRAKARSFLVDGWQELFRCVNDGLTPEGRGHLVFKDEVGLRGIVARALEDCGLGSEFHQGSGVVFLELFRLNVD